MHTPQDLLANNRRWAHTHCLQDDGFFSRHLAGQHPEFLWIGCADSRIHASDIVAVEPGHLFVHRNIANLAIPTDLNSLAVIDYAVNTLGVRHIIVCGHGGCGGVAAALGPINSGLVNHWLQPVRELALKHRPELDAIADPSERVTRLAEINAITQAINIASSPVVQLAWAAGRELSVRPWLYELSSGLLRDLGVCLENHAGLCEARQLR
jgi:carbonic anhydrase